MASVGWSGLRPKSSEGTATWNRSGPQWHTIQIGIRGSQITRVLVKTILLSEPWIGFTMRWYTLGATLRSTGSAGALVGASCPWQGSVLSCRSCGGDRTKRHNLVRNVGVRLATAAGWRPEPEKPGLLRPRPAQGNLFEDGSEVREVGRGPEARRPADIYVPRWDLGGEAALDFAVTSGLRTDLLEQTAADGLSCLKSYE